MDNPKHTPGPWRVDGLYLNQLGVWAGTGAIVAEVKAGSHENVDGTDTAMTNDEYDANAALIAAAPDMYEALVAAERQFDAWDELEPVEDLAYAILFIEDVRAALGYFRALAKAEGR